MAFWDSLLQIGSGLVGGLLGGASGSNKNNATETQTQDPWKVQQPYLLGGFQGATNAYTDAMKNPVYTGALYAGLDPMQMQAIQGTAGFANGLGNTAATSTINNSLGVMGNAANGMNNAASGLFGMAGSDPTQGNINAAGAYADNPFLSGAIDAASRDVTRNLTEDVLPGINRMGSATGNTNSSRTGIAEGIALRGAQDRIGDISATMRGDAWNNGLRTAEAARQGNMSAMGTAGNLYNSAMDNALRGAAAGTTMGYNNLDALSKAGGMLQGNQQSLLNEGYQKYMNQQTMPFDWLDRYMTAVKGNYGGTTVSSANNGNPSWLNALQGGLGGAAGGLSLYNNFKDIFSK